MLSREADSLGFPLPLLVAIAAAAAVAAALVVLAGRRGETDRTRSARTASLNVVMVGRGEARGRGLQIQSYAGKWVMAGEKPMDRQQKVESTDEELSHERDSESEVRKWDKIGFDRGVLVWRRPSQFPQVGCGSAGAGVDCER